MGRRDVWEERLCTPDSTPNPNTNLCGGPRRRRLAATTLEAVRALPVRPSYARPANCLREAVKKKSIVVF